METVETIEEAVAGYSHLSSVAFDRAEAERASAERKAMAVAASAGGFPLAVQDERCKRGLGLGHTAHTLTLLAPDEIIDLRHIFDGGEAGGGGEAAFQVGHAYANACTAFLRSKVEQAAMAHAAEERFVRRGYVEVYFCDTVREGDARAPAPADALTEQQFDTFIFRLHDLRGEIAQKSLRGHATLFLTSVYESVHSLPLSRPATLQLLGECTQCTTQTQTHPPPADGADGADGADAANGLPNPPARPPLHDAPLRLGAALMASAAARSRSPPPPPPPPQFPTHTPAPAPAPPAPAPPIIAIREFALRVKF